MYAYIVSAMSPGGIRMGTPALTSRYLHTLTNCAYIHTCINTYHTYIPYIHTIHIHDRKSHINIFDIDVVDQ